ncbi:PHD finger protein 3 isoform X2 [Callorhinchus milii]|uniref:PHD finger protein 3 n=1 Tax=Callorhinchus milii TaxID=7868 RepID=A0A4W3JSP6_CALMI|nr:PHD finger protein 3 isoform X2 [Callorhinchus milii]|eukprot:gi/632953188/ref/XP_007892268.1/ PREDICTED: PHD finger protein 3 isoform X2 [Callorhinchus milii]
METSPMMPVSGLELPDESGVKESSLDTMEEEDLSELCRKGKAKSPKATSQSSRKSPRLLAQETVRNLRNSTIAKRSSPANLSPVKRKEPMKNPSAGTSTSKPQDQQEKPAKQKTEATDKPQQENVSENLQSDELTDCGTAESESVASRRLTLRSMGKCVVPDSELERSPGNCKSPEEQPSDQNMEFVSETSCCREPLMVLEPEETPPATLVEEVDNVQSGEVQVESGSPNPIESALELPCSSKSLTEMETDITQDSMMESADVEKVANDNTDGDVKAESTDNSSLKSALESQHSTKSLIGPEEVEMLQDDTLADDLQTIIESDVLCRDIQTAVEELKDYIEEQNTQLNANGKNAVTDVNEQKDEPNELDPVTPKIGTQGVSYVEDLLPKVEDKLENMAGEELDIPLELITCINAACEKEAFDTPSALTSGADISEVVTENISSAAEVIKNEPELIVSEKNDDAIPKENLEPGMKQPTSSEVIDISIVSESEGDDGSSSDPMILGKIQDETTEQQMDMKNEDIGDLSENKEQEEGVAEKPTDGNDSLQEKPKETFPQPKKSSSKHEKAALKPQPKLAQETAKPEQTDKVHHPERKKAKWDIQSSETLQQSKPHTLSVTKRKAVDQDVHHPHKPVKCLKTQLAQDAKAKIEQPQKKSFCKPSPDSQAGRMQTAFHDKSKKTIQVPKHGSKPIPRLSHTSAKQLTHFGQKSVASTAGKIVSQQGDTTKEKDKGKVVELSSEDDKEKLKAKRSEKGIAPRQRRSSKSLSLDEPPLFIPDNLPAVKKEGDVEHSTDIPTPELWDPKKLCGFCKKAHNSRFMVGCGRCDDWFHGDCVGLSLTQAQLLEKEDKEYICLKCCAEEDKKILPVNHSHTIKHQTSQDDTEKSKPELSCENVAHLKNEKPSRAEERDTTMTGLKPKSEMIEKTELSLNDKKHKVKILKKGPSARTSSTESKDSESRDTKRTHLVNERSPGQITMSTSQPPEDRKDKLLKDPSAPRLGQGEKPPKLDLKEKQLAKKKLEKTASNSASTPANPSTAQPTVEQIRQNVRHSLKDILAKRLSQTDMKIPEERATKVAGRIERELFSFFRDTDTKYKSKYRSLMFNLKDAKNQVLFKRVLKGDITPGHLIRMSPEELASKELAAWRKRENRHTIEMIEKEQREVERRPITKITHKGEIEIESEAPPKEPETVVVEEDEPKVVEPKPVVEKLEDNDEETTVEDVNDTTCHHKKHLFDLNCKICTGRMAPPVEELSPPKVKVASSVTRRQSEIEVEPNLLADALPSASSILPFDMTVEERPESSQPSVSRSDTLDAPEDESRFLARLDSLWKGFVNMHSVAKFVTKAYPVSGSVEHLTEDLPDTIQVGGRIPPQTVWDYVDKIKASGTKEICVIRFAPVTEEDQITYTSLYAYFSSRQRYGVVANNVKQVKDMYLIPLGLSEKIPYRLLPFDGPGLELARQNLLLGLIIRQRIKKLHSTSVSEEASESDKAVGNVPQEKKSKVEYVNDEDEVDDEDENQFFNSFTSVLAKFRSKPKQLPPVVEPQIPKPPVEIPIEPVIIPSTKPLRFLPGVLVGWENQPDSLELPDKPLDDILQSLLGEANKEIEQLPMSGLGPDLGEPATDDKTDPEILEKLLPDKTSEDQGPVESKLEDDQEETEQPNKDLLEDTNVEANSKADECYPALTLKDKPPDVPTEIFLSSLAPLKSQPPDQKEEQEKLRHQFKVKKVKVENSKEQKEDLNASTSQPVTPIPDLALSEPTTNDEEVVDSAQGASPSVLANVSPESAQISRVAQLLNLCRDPRQAAGRNQQSNSAIGKPVEEKSTGEQQLDNSGDNTVDKSLHKEDGEDNSDNLLEPEEGEWTITDGADEPVQESIEQGPGKMCHTALIARSRFQLISNPTRQTEILRSLHKGEGQHTPNTIQTHTIETVQSIRRELPPGTPLLGPHPGAHFDFASQLIANHNQSHGPTVSTVLQGGGSSMNPAAGRGNYPPSLLELRTFPQLQGNSGFPFQGGLLNANFQTQGNSMPSFMSGRPPPLLPSPYRLQNPHLRFHSPDPGAAHALLPNHMVPWPPPIPCLPHHHMGLMHLGAGQTMPSFPADHSNDANRYIPNSGTPNFQPIKDDHRQDHWDRHSQRSESSLSKDRGSRHRQRLYSESYHRRKDRHKERERERDSYWERDRDKYKEKDRDKERDRDRERRSQDRHRDKDRDRHRERERSRDGMDSKRERSKERDRGRSENDDSDQERGKGRSRDKDREKVHEKEKDAERDRQHRGKDHDKRDRSDRSKRRKRRSSSESNTD